MGVALDACGSLFIADTGGNKVRRVNLATGIITTVAGSGPTGGAAAYPGSYGDGGLAAAALLADAKRTDVVVFVEPRLRGSP